MSWWAKTQLLPLVVAAGLAAAVLGAAATGGISFPALGGVSFAEVPYFSLAPLLACATLAATTTRATTAVLATTVRYAALRTLAVSFVPILIVGITDLSCAAWAGSAIWLSTRITIGEIGLQLLTGAIFGYRYQALGPAFAVLVAALFGRDGSRAARWAWPIDSRLDGWAWILPAVICGAGVVAHLLLARRQFRSG